MTPADVERRVQKITKTAEGGDDESAHCDEDALHMAVLKAIAKGKATDPVECARIALTTTTIQFARWYA